MSRVQCQAEVPNHLHPNNLKNWSLDPQLWRQGFYANPLGWVVASGITTTVLYEGGKYDPDNLFSLTS